MNISKAYQTAGAAENYSTASVAKSAYASSGPIIDPSSCQQDNLINSVIVPSFLDALPAQDSLSGRAINHLTNVYDLVGSLQTELCEDGTISQQSARELGGVVGRTFTSSVVTYGTGVLASIGLVTGGPIVAAGVVGLGVAGLAVLPPIAERVVNWGFDQFQGLLNHTEKWIDSQR